MFFWRLPVLLEVRKFIWRSVMLLQRSLVLSASVFGRVLYLMTAAEAALDWHIPVSA
jgi:hypothetical protein